MELILFFLLLCKHAIADLAMEAKFMSSIRHPNICKMRAIAGTPGNEDFMVIMDCLSTTLRERMNEWRQQQGRTKSSFLERLLLNNDKKNNNKYNKNRNGNAEILQFQRYEQKLLAMWDAARAIRYLHNHS